MWPIVLALLSAFSIGERLEYSVRYGPIDIGTLELQVLPRDSVAGEDCLHLRGDLEFNRSFSWLFWAKYRLESWCRVSDFVTTRSCKRTREPKYRAEWTAEFDHSAGAVFYSDSGRRSLPDSARDMLSLWYYFRVVPIRPGDTVRVNAHVDRRDYRLTATLTGVKQVRTPAGLFDCDVLSPKAGTPLGTVYLSHDDERLPVVIRTRFGGVPVSAYLRKVSTEEK